MIMTIDCFNKGKGIIMEQKFSIKDDHNKTIFVAKCNDIDDTVELELRGKQGYQTINIDELNRQIAEGKRLYKSK